MSQEEEKNESQAALWNGAGGQAWVEMQELMDQLLEPFQTVLVDAVAALPVRSFLDVGCGSGGTTVALARRLGPGAESMGIDVSEPMVTAARQRAEREGVAASFIHADAQRHSFEPGGFDVITSRFGVMFFDDFVAAFANLRTATREGGHLRCLTWRRAEKNPFMTTAERAAAPFVDIPARTEGEPGQFGLADDGRIRSILDDSGWSGIEVHPVDVSCALALDDLDRYLTNLGPVGRAMADLAPSARIRVLEAVRPAFDPFVEGDEVRFTAACWMVSARG